MTRAVYALVAWLLALAPAVATTLIRATLDDLIVKSTAIVRGTVVSAAASASGSAIVTRVRVKVAERWKGPDEAFIDVTLPGGAFNGFTQNIAGVPVLSEGKEYVFFLWTGRNRVTQLLGLAQGVLDIVRNADGEALVVRGAIDAAIVDPASGKLVRDEAIRLRLSEFRSRVTLQLGGGASR